MKSCHVKGTSHIYRVYSTYLDGGIPFPPIIRPLCPPSPLEVGPLPFLSLEVGPHWVRGQPGQTYSGAFYLYVFLFNSVLLFDLSLKTVKDGMTVGKRGCKIIFFNCPWLVIIRLERVCDVSREGEGYVGPDLWKRKVLNLE